MPGPKFAPRDVFETLLEWSVLPTFDLLVVVKGQGVVVVKRRIEPYKNQWALPGLRMYKGESINDTLKRIAKDELGLSIDAAHKQLLAQYVGKFKTEKNRQDLSTAYMVAVDGPADITYNKEHFSDCKLATEPLPRMGAMYTYYLHEWSRQGL